MDAWVDGRRASAIGLGNRGLAYGDGLFETIRVRGARLSLLERHLARLALGCQRLGLPLDEPLLRGELQAYADALGDGVIKLIVTRGDSPRGYAVDPTAPARRIMLGSPLPDYPAQRQADGISLYPCQVRLAEQPLLAGLKHLNRLEQVLARAEWQGTEYAEGLMRDLSGRVIEGVFSNLFLVCDDQLYTPDLSRCGVAGTLRAELLARAAAKGQPVRVEDVDLSRLAGASEAFMCNSVYGIWPVRRCGELTWPVGPHTRKLQQMACELLDI
ncbi:aminodeoxychorismate lyase [Pseudomonas sp. RIT-PI-S]|uniref:aminodeoxychorismate lyase n=1 Tax=Pseudomonas sp. RIT-PI-S TaxID=3035295 RepID=UPI0021D85D48|nr:aminodeoxychorismate lyase [Pseudomonas sp. RIT-PI-S]